MMLHCLNSRSRFWVNFGLIFSVSAIQCNIHWESVHRYRSANSRSSCFDVNLVALTSASSSVLGTNIPFIKHSASYWKCVKPYTIRNPPFVAGMLPLFQMRSRKCRLPNLLLFQSPALVCCSSYRLFSAISPFLIYSVLHPKNNSLPHFSISGAIVLSWCSALQTSRHNAETWFRLCGSISFLVVCTRWTEVLASGSWDNIFSFILASRASAAGNLLQLLFQWFPWQNEYSLGAELRNDSWVYLCFE